MLLKQSIIIKTLEGRSKTDLKKTNLPRHSQNLQIDQEPWHREDAVTCFLTISCFESEAEWKKRLIEEKNINSTG